MRIAGSLWLAAAAFAAGLAAVGVGALAYIQTGWFNATAAAPHERLIGWATHDAMIHSVQLRARGVTAPARFSPDQVRAGFHLYDSECAMCHGGPGLARAGWTRGLTPTPPFVIDSARGWTRAELYWIVAKGVKMTAMPAWGLSRSEAQVWDVVAFLEALPFLSARDYASMRAADRAASPPPATGQDPCASIFSTPAPSPPASRTTNSPGCVRTTPSIGTPSPAAPASGR